MSKKIRDVFCPTVHNAKWATNGTLAEIDAPIVHFSFSNYSDMLKILESRTTRIAKELFDLGRRINVLTPFFHGIAMFFNVYFLRLGFLDGFDGFVISLTRAGGSFFKYAKLFELQGAQEESI